MTQAELAILSLVTEKPRHGYEIEQVIEERGMREWTTIGFSSIYYILNKLEKAKLIEATIRDHEGTGPARKVYRATTQGRKKTQEGVLEALSNPAKRISPLQIGLANLPGVDREAAVSALEAYGQALKVRIDELNQKQNSLGSLPLYVSAMFSHSLTLLEAERRWIEAFREEWENEDDED